MNTTSILNKETSKNYLWNGIKWPLAFVIGIWVIHFLQIFTPFEWRHLGVRPQTVDGLWGILLSPLLHSGIPHLVSNSFPFLFLGTLIALFYKQIAFKSFILIYFFAGLALWTFGRPVNHIGASGVVYGMVAFIFWLGIFRRNPKAILLSLIVLFMYSGLFMGVLPNQEGVSWEGHLLGAFAGVLVAFIFRKDIEPDEKEKKYRWELEEEGEKKHFLPRDAFDLKKHERNTLEDWFRSEE